MSENTGDKDEKLKEAKIKLEEAKRELVRVYNDLAGILELAKKLKEKVKEFEEPRRNIPITIAKFNYLFNVEKRFIDKINVSLQRLSERTPNILGIQPDAFEVEGKKKLSPTQFEIKLEEAISLIIRDMEIDREEKSFRFLLNRVDKFHKWVFGGEGKAEKYKKKRGRVDDLNLELNRLIKEFYKFYGVELGLEDLEKYEEFLRTVEPSSKKKSTKSVKGNLVSRN